MRQGFEMQKQTWESKLRHLENNVSQKKTQLEAIQRRNRERKENENLRREIEI